MKSKAVIGCLFGDEGKGKVVSYLCSQSPNSLVIRYSGGQQAGHHVVLRNGLDHVFSNFGSGSLQGCDTYWSKYCTVDPVGILNEYDVLKKKGISPVLYIDERCPITTPYDKRFNIDLDNSNQHGSCGVGVGQTFQREQNYYSLLFGDLYYPSVLKIKLELIRKYYSSHACFDEFVRNCVELSSIQNINPVHGIPSAKKYQDYVFEGSQGLLLDQDIGFFPHVTRSSTGITNIHKMGFSPEIFLVTRAYQTRHGNGPMTNEHILHDIKNNPYENNYDNGFQGKFRRTILDLDMLKYGIYRAGLNSKCVNLVITCLDLINEYSLTLNSKKTTFTTEGEFVDKIKHELLVKEIYLSRNPFPEVEFFYLTKQFL
jgi:adenylosuccinate synthase